MKKTVYFLIAFSWFCIQAGAATVSTIQLQNPTASAITPHMVTFGHVFIKGQVPKGTNIVILTGSTQIPTQFDVKTRYADSSAKHGIITFKAPALAASAAQSAQVQTTTTAQGTDVNITTLPASGWSFSVQIIIKNGATFNIDAAALLSRRLADKKISYWLKGAQATEVRIDTFITSSMHMTFDIRAFADGSVRTDAQFNNDYALQPVGGSLIYSTTITQNGTQVFSYLNLPHHQYQTWHKMFWTNGEPQVNIKRDILTLEKAGAIWPYDLAFSGTADLITSSADLLAQTTWGKPLSNNGITTYMGMTGGRPDIGPTTGWNAAWLITQNATLEKVCLGQADVGGHVPWNLYNPTRGRYVDLVNHPDAWYDYRQADWGYATQFPQFSLDGTWNLNGAHMPALTFVPYLLTGTRYYLDKLNAQASWGLLHFWPAYRNQDIFTDLAINFQCEVRAQAWVLREAVTAAYANPDGSADKTYFTTVVDDNFEYASWHMDEWTALQGEAHGVILGDYGYESNSPPWQQDYMASSVVLAVLHGNQKALNFLNWTSNFLIGRFQARPGWSQNDGAAYLLVVAKPGVCMRWDCVGPADGFLKTWAEIGAATVAAGGSNGTGWSKSEGDYISLAQMSLAGIVVATGSSQALAAYNWIEANGNQAFMHKDVQQAFVPNPNLLANRTTPVAIETSNAMPKAALRLSVSPNPFHASAEIALYGKGAHTTSLKIYDVTGKQVADLTGAIKDNRVMWNAAKAPAGVYLAKLKAGERNVLKRLVVVK